MPACEVQTQAGASAEYLRAFNRKVVAQRIPLSGTLALTGRCNLRCRMCYLPDGSGGKGNGAGELDTMSTFRILDECAAAGCLSLLLTGGEPLLRTDFAAVYRHARELGILVTVFSNGTLVTDRHVALWRDLPPQAVEITLYGATAATYERLTGVAGSYARCRRGIERLLARDIVVRLKTVITTVNVREVEAMEQLARDYGVRFRMDGSLFPGLDGDRRALQLRVTPDVTAAKEFADPARAREWREFWTQQRSRQVDTERLYRCGAGATAFYVDPAGGLQACLMVRSVRYDLMDGSFAEGWRRIVAAMDAKKSSENSICRGCERQVVCGYCPGFFELETGSENVASEYFCALGQERLARMGVA